jgi:hypothetical protein
VRGSKGSKVLRTRKVQLHPEYINMYSYFCSNGCYNDFANKYIQQVIAIAPRREPLETPIEVEKVTTKKTKIHINGLDNWTETKIMKNERCDNFIHGPCIMVHGTRQNNRKE